MHHLTDLLTLPVPLHAVILFCVLSGGVGYVWGCIKVHRGHLNEMEEFTRDLVEAGLTREKRDGTSSGDSQAGFHA